MSEADAAFWIGVWAGWLIFATLVLVLDAIRTILKDKP